jgi:hypothetical protein
MLIMALWKLAIPTAVLSIALAIPSRAQSPIRGPMLGWVWDAQKETIRPVLGIAGSSVLGKSLELEFAIKYAAISHSREYALALAGDSRDLLFVDLKPISPVSNLIDGVPRGADRLVLSPRGLSALAIYAENRKILVITGLDSQPAALREIDVSVEGAPEAAAISDDGSLLLAAYPESHTLLFVGPEGNRWKAPVEDAVKAAAFLAGTRDAVVASEGGVFLLPNVTSGSESRRLWEGKASAVSWSTPSRFLLAEAGTQSIVEMDLEGQITRTAQCPCLPSALHPMAAGGVFRLNEVSRDPLWLVEISDSGMRTIFVPPDPGSELED